jgi:hypothetical protein
VYQEKLACVRTAVDTWLHNSQAAVAERAQGGGGEPPCGGPSQLLQTRFGGGGDGGPVQLGRLQRPVDREQAKGAGCALAAVVAQACLPERGPCFGPPPSTAHDAPCGGWGADQTQPRHQQSLGRDAISQDGAELRLPVIELPEAGRTSGPNGVPVDGAAAPAACSSQYGPGMDALRAAAAAAAAAEAAVVASAPTPCCASPRAGAWGQGRPRMRRGDSLFAHLPAWRRGPARWWHQWQLFRAFVDENPDYADSVAHM